MIVLLERFSIECRKTNHPSQSQSTQIIQWTNQNSKYLHVADAKRGKKRASESRLVLVLLLIGWKSGASFLNQSGGVVNAMPITFRHSGENRFIVNFEVIAPENPNGKAQRAKIASLRLSVDNTKKPFCT